MHCAEHMMLHDHVRSAAQTHSPPQQVAPRETGQAKPGVHGAGSTQPSGQAPASIHHGFGASAEASSASTSDCAATRDRELT
jgi:hypothetical protein